MVEEINRSEKMKGKIIIKSEIEVKTGLHIGTDDSFSAIGGVDSPVIKDVKTQKPIIPGSSLKGKIRSLLAQNLNETAKEHREDDKRILRLFGTTEKTPEKTRLQFSDCFMSKEQFDNTVPPTEVKYENTINRVTGVANPRQMERVIRGMKFDFVLVYNIVNPDEVESDFNTLIQGLKLLQVDYLGGGGTRGSGRVAFKNFKLVTEYAEGFDEELIKKITGQLKDVTENAELLY